MQFFRTQSLQITKVRQTCGGIVEVLDLCQYQSRFFVIRGVSKLFIIFLANKLAKIIIKQ